MAYTDENGNTYVPENISRPATFPEECFRSEFARRQTRKQLMKQVEELRFEAKSAAYESEWRRTLLVEAQATIDALVALLPAEGPPGTVLIQINPDGAVKEDASVFQRVGDRWRRAGENSVFSWLSLLEHYAPFANLFTPAQAEAGEQA